MMARLFYKFPSVLVVVFGFASYLSSGHAEEVAKVFPNDLDTKDAEFIFKNYADFSTMKSSTRTKINIEGRIVHFQRVGAEGIQFSDNGSIYQKSALQSARADATAAKRSSLPRPSAASKPSRHGQ